MRDREHAYGVVADVEADEPAGGHRAAEKDGPHTIASLGLDIEAARGMGIQNLFPVRLEARWGENIGSELPLPSSRDEIAILADLQMPPKKCEVRTYLRRARGFMRNNMTRASRALARVNKSVHEAGAVARAVQETRTRTNEVLRLAREEVRAEAAKVIATMTELSDLAKSVESRIMGAFMADQTINGEQVKPEVALAASKAVQGYIAKVGAGVLDADAKTESEETLLREYVESTKKRLETAPGGGDAGKTH